MILIKLFKRLIVFIYLSLLASLKAEVITESFYSNALGYEMYYQIVLPIDYYAETEASFPSIYFLHGFGADYSWYESIIDVHEDMILSGELNSSILIKPDGFVLPYLGSMYTNSEYNGQFEDYIVQDLIQHIDENYNTKQDPKFRAIMGHSMGGYGAVKLSVKFPELFQVVASHSGPIVFQNLISDLLPILIDETGILGYQPWNGSVSLFLYSASAAFSPDITDFPYYVDLPVDDNGNIIEDVWQLWLDHNPIDILIDNHSDIQSHRFYLDCGDMDAYLFQTHLNPFTQILDQMGIAYNSYIYSGDHFSELLNGNRFPYSLSYINNAFIMNELFSSLGDLDNDGIVDIIDLSLLLQIILGINIASDGQQISSDLDFNNLIDVLDILILADQL